MTLPGPALPDVNVLVAATWPNHAAHRAARAWFDDTQEWATTPFTEAGFVRVSSNRAALPLSTSPALALELLRRLCELPGHVFWPDTVQGVVAPGLGPRLSGHRQVTDAHLLAVSEGQGGHLVTFDRGVAELATDRSAHVLMLTAAT